MSNPDTLTPVTAPAPETARRAGLPPSAAALRRAPDEQLVALVEDGSTAAFEEISARYRGPLHAYCARLVGPSQAEDVVQQALLRAYMGLRRGDVRDGALRAWLYRIARNASIDLLRSRPPEHEQLDLEFDGVPQPPRLFEQKQDIGQLVSALRALPEGQRRALTLREMEGRSLGEISDVLGQSPPRVRQLIFRARETLRAGLGAFLPGGFVRRLLGHQPVVIEAHHTALAAKLSSGGTVEVVGAMAAAALTLLAGSAATPAATVGAGRPAAIVSGPLHGPLHGARDVSGSAGPSADRLRANAASAAGTAGTSTGGTALSIPDRSFSVALPAAENASAGGAPVRAAGSSDADVDPSAPAPADLVSAPADPPSADAPAATGATGPTGPADGQQPDPQSGGAPAADPSSQGSGGSILDLDAVSGGDLGS
jgi:RNA polymerase sigma-70 factor (ECF subfamily)